MNKQFVMKMVQAKKLQYEAMREILPEGILKRVEHLEGELLELGKECFTALMDMPNGASSSSAGSKSVARKVTIE